MVFLIPSLSASVSCMTTGERRLAGRLDAKGLTERVHVRNFHKRGRQQLYKRQRSKHFSFKSVGIQAQGRTTVLKINYRNTRQILQTASQIAGGLLTADNSEQGDDGIPLLLPVSCGREGPEPMVINLPTLHEEAAKVAELLRAAHQEGHAWGDMAMLCRHYDGMEECARALTRRRLPHQVRKGSGDFRPLEDSIKVMTMHVSKGLEFPIVAVMRLNESSTKQEEVQVEARLLYVAATRATQRLFYFDESASVTGRGVTCFGRSAVPPPRLTGSSNAATRSGIAMANEVAGRCIVRESALLFRDQLFKGGSAVIAVLQRWFVNVRHWTVSCLSGNCVIAGRASSLRSRSPVAGDGPCAPAGPVAMPHPSAVSARIMLAAHTGGVS